MSHTAQADKIVIENILEEFTMEANKHTHDERRNSNVLADTNAKILTQHDATSEVIKDPTSAERASIHTETTALKD